MRWTKNKTEKGKRTSRYIHAAGRCGASFKPPYAQDVTGTTCLTASDLFTSRDSWPITNGHNSLTTKFAQFNWTTSRSCLLNWRFCERTNVKITGVFMVYWETQNIHKQLRWSEYEYHSIMITVDQYNGCKIRSSWHQSSQNKGNDDITQFRSRYVVLVSDMLIVLQFRLANDDTTLILYTTLRCV